jgi:hypothetical protein
MPLLLGRRRFDECEPACHDRPGIGDARPLLRQRPMIACIGVGNSVLRLAHWFPICPRRGRDPARAAFRTHARGAQMSGTWELRPGRQESMAALG